VPGPERRTRTDIDRLHARAGRAVQDAGATDLHAARGVALSEFELNPGCGAP